jgi:xanthine dehydrogenase large subunit
MKLGRPVKLVLTRDEDMRFTGKRHPYDFDYKLGLDITGRMVAYEATYYQNSGAAADLSPAVMERSLLHATGVYAIPNVRIKGLMCRTNLAPFTAFRGFGAPQAVFCMEAALDHGARALGLPPREVQRRNLLKSGDALPSGMIVERVTALRAFSEASARCDIDKIDDEVRRFNASHPFEKQGTATMPICFGISFTNTFLNQAGALVHIYQDGTVSLNTGAVEMGQGVSSKLIAVAAATLGVSADIISVENTHTGKVPNTSPTAASSGADLNGMAVKTACDALRSRLLDLAGTLTEIGPGSLSITGGAVRLHQDQIIMPWQSLVSAAYTNRIGLSEAAHYFTPNIYYDKQKEKGRPFAYHVFGAAVVRATVDVLRGTYRVTEVDIFHDVGRSLDPLIDRGQVEGAVVQGIGWMTVEELLYEDGRLSTDSLSTYKVPDLPSAPTMRVHFLEDADNPEAIMQSKAIGEPPLLYGIGAYFAIAAAVRAYLPHAAVPYDAPFTNERLLAILTTAEQTRQLEERS